MTRDDIIRMAKEAGLEFVTDNLEEFANLVAAAEREACAKVCDELADDAAKQQDFHAIHACESCANEIRSRGGDDNN